MDLVWQNRASGTPPALPVPTSRGYPAAGVPGAATQPGPYWFHMVTQELMNVVLDAGITPDAATLTQVRDAIPQLMARANWSQGASYPNGSFGKALQDTLAGQPKFDGSAFVVPGAASPQVGLPRGQWLRYTDTSDVRGYAIRRVDYAKVGRISDGGNDIAEALIARWDDIHSGFVWSRWDVAMSPLKEGSGRPGAPTVSQSFFVLKREINPQNRYDVQVFQPEARLYTNPVAGEQMVPETQDFTGTLGGTRIGYDVAFGWRAARSPFMSNVSGRHAGFCSIWLTDPNAVAPGGYAHYATGFTKSVTAVAIVSGGSGYRVNDAVFLNSGLDQSINEDAMVLVKTVNGSGAILTAEVFAGGSYIDTPTGTLGVTPLQGASATPGTGAMFTFTLSTQGAEAPRAWLGLSGTWLYGIDFCPNPDKRIARFVNAAFRLPNGGNLSTGGLVFKGALSGGDIPAVNVNSNDQVVIGTQVVIHPTPWTLASVDITADTGAFSSVSASGGVYSQINGWVEGSVTLAVGASGKGTAAGAYRIPMPTAPSQNFTFVGNETVTGKLVRGFYNTALGYARITFADGTDPIANSSFVELDFRYRA